MSEEKDAEQQESAASHRDKHPYVSPRLSRYGPVRELTASGSDPMMEDDGMMGMGDVTTRRD